MTGKLNYAGDGMAAKAAKVPFLIDRPKRLKIAVTHRIERVEVISNRIKIGGSPSRENRAIRRAGISGFRSSGIGLAGSFDFPTSDAIGSAKCPPAERGLHHSPATLQLLPDPNLD
jgi:hypothetical protein